MSTIRKLSVEELDDLIKININAYPGIYQNVTDLQSKLKQSLTRTQQEDPHVNYFGLFRDSKLLGGMRIHTYQMNLFGKMIQIGGVGSVGVDLLHKKEKVAKELIQEFIHMFKRQNSPIVALYPFRPDFYKKMGFGYGAKISQYKVEPSSFPFGKLKDKIRFLTNEDTQKVFECFNRYARMQHGMVEKTEFEAELLFKNQNNLMVGYVNGEKVEGYLQFSFKKESETNFTYNDIHVKEFVYETNEALEQLMTFLHTQNDQINRVVLNIQDDDFHFLLHDPRNGSNNLIPIVNHESHLSGIGIMYRVIDTVELFNVLRGHNFNNVTCKVKLNITDSFLSANNKSVVVHFNEGTPIIDNGNDFEVEMSLDISDFSSLIMGSTKLNSLYRLGLVKLSDQNYVNLLTTLFLTPSKPVCMTTF